MTSIVRFGCHRDLGLIVCGSTTFGSSELDNLATLEQVVCDIASKQQTRRIVVSLDKTTSYGAALCGLLVSLHVSAKAAGKTLAITGDHLSIIKLCGIDNVIPVHQSLNDVCA